VLFNFSAANIKRTLKCSLTKENRNLRELFSVVNKTHWLIREPYYKHQWSFLLGTNWASFPAYKSIGLYSIDSKEGQEILEKLIYTKEEYANIKDQNSEAF